MDDKKDVRKKDEPKISQVKGSQIRITSPRAGGTVPQTGGKAVGILDLQGGTLSKIECEFLHPGTTTSAEAPFEGKVHNATLKAWNADINSKLDGKYDLVARLYTTAKATPVDTDTVAGVYVRPSPQVTITKPPHLAAPPAGGVEVSVSLASGHGFDTITCKFVDLAGTDYFTLTTSVAATGPVGGLVGEMAGETTKIAYTASVPPGNNYVFVATATALAKTESVSVGGLQLT
jgi:hypothetical protein